MFANYLRVAVRNLIKHPLFSLINVIGLAVGLATCLLISLFVRDELSYDRHWAKADALYRLNTTFEVPGREPFVTVQAQGPVPAQLLSYFEPQVAAVTRLQSMWPVLRHGDKSFSEQVHWTDPATADLFDLQVLHGDLTGTLGDNASLAVDESFARKHFGRADIVGEVVNLRVFDLNRDFRIGAVFADLPHNTVLEFQALAMIDEGDWTAQPFLFEHWFSVNNVVYFELRDGADIDSIASRLEEFTDASVQIPPGVPGALKASEIIRYSVQPLVDIQLNPAGMGEMKPTGDMGAVLVFAAIAGLTLLIACINFMNLATARSTQRAREVALRKVMGARRGQLVTQFLGESVLLALVGLLIGLVLVELILPAYGDFLGKDLVLSYGDGFTLSIMLALVLAVGVLGGVYPALVLSAFLPSHVLKANKSAESQGSARLRSALVVFQFAVSIVLIIATATVYMQMQYATSIDPGFSKDRLLTIQGFNRQGVAERQESLRQEILGLPFVTGVARSSEEPFSSNENNTTVRLPEDTQAGSILLGMVRVDFDFFRVLETRLLAGRLLGEAHALDRLPRLEDVPADQIPRGNMLINESAVRRLGLGSPREAIGRTLYMDLGPGEEREGHFTIVGVVGDMRFQSLKSVVRPEMFLHIDEPAGNLLVRFDGRSSAAASAIEELWRGMVPDVPISYRFADEVAAEEFRQEAGMGAMLATFSVLAVIIACLGLYGLASFTAERRTREIGIRRVLGARVTHIVGLLLWQFTRPVLLANLLAWPVAAWSMLRWLENFPVRLDTWVLLLLCCGAGLLALLIAWLTVGGNAALVARRSPIEALRYE